MKDLFESLRIIVKKLNKSTGIPREAAFIDYLKAANETSQIIMHEKIKELAEKYSRGALSFEPDNGSNKWLLFVSQNRAELFQLMGSLAAALDEAEKTPHIKNIEDALNSELAKCKVPKGFHLEGSVEYSSKKNEYSATLKINERSFTMTNPNPKELLELITFRNSIIVAVKHLIRNIRKA